MKFMRFANRPFHNHFRIPIPLSLCRRNSSLLPWLFCCPPPWPQDNTLETTGTLDSDRWLRSTSFRPRRSALATITVVQLCAMRDRTEVLVITIFVDAPFRWGGTLDDGWQVVYPIANHCHRLPRSLISTVVVHVIEP